MVTIIIWPVDGIACMSCVNGGGDLELREKMKLEDERYRLERRPWLTGTIVGRGVAYHCSLTQDILSTENGTSVTSKEEEEWRGRADRDQSTDHPFGPSQPISGPIDLGISIIDGMHVVHHLSTNPTLILNSPHPPACWYTFFTMTIKYLILLSRQGKVVSNPHFFALLLKAA